MTKVKPENFITIQGWMLTELKLKGNALIVYAIIYGFSQTDGQTFAGSLQYLADWTNSTKRGIMKNLQDLVQAGLIGKKEKIINGVKFCEYYVTKFTRVVNKVQGGIEQSSPNNIKDNIEDNIDNTKVLEKTPETFGNSDINDLFEAWERVCGYKITSKVKLNRYTCQRLLKSRGKESILKALPYVAESQSDKYAPNIVNFMDLEEKWNALGVWYKKKYVTNFNKNGKITI